jgi:long-subunit fatty acid transport protein
VNPGALLAATLWASTALGSPSGGLFAGPVRSTGASLYWNPAAVVTEPFGTFTNVELTGVVLGAGFQRESEGLPHEPADYERVSFWTGAPDLAFVVGSTPRWPNFRLVGGGASRSAQATAWPDDGPQRFFDTGSSLIAYTVAGGAAFTTNGRWGVALLGGPTYVRIRLNQAIDFGAFANASLEPGGELFIPEDPAMQGSSAIALSGWALTGILGAWVEPLPELRLGASLNVTKTPTLHGTVEVTAPEVFREQFADYDISPSGELSLPYPLPLIANLEAELRTEVVTVAALFQYHDRSRQRILLGTVTEAESQIIAGQQVSVKQTHDDWTAGVRVSHRIGDTLEVGGRVDWDPRYIPREAITPVNLDFTTVDIGAGGRYAFGKGRSLTLTYYYTYVAPVEVTDSVYNPRAPSSSGLNLPSARGSYDGWAHRLIASFEGLWGGADDAP